MRLRIRRIISFFSQYYIFYFFYRSPCSQKIFRDKLASAGRTHTHTHAVDFREQASQIEHQTQHLQLILKTLPHINPSLWGNLFMRKSVGWSSKHTASAPHLASSTVYMTKTEKPTRLPDTCTRTRRSRKFQRRHAQATVPSQIRSSRCLFTLCLSVRDMASNAARRGTARHGRGTSPPQLTTLTRFRHLVHCRHCSPGHTASAHTPARKNTEQRTQKQIWHIHTHRNIL